MAEELERDAVELLQRLLRFNTVNPPGNERAAQEHLAALLAEVGFDCKLLGRTPERPNLIARLDGTQEGPTLCLLGHVDTVSAEPSEWTHDPWSGDLADGFVWGRGALDMKGQVAAEVAAACALARSGWRPARGALLIVCVCDEEAGGGDGARWLVDEHPDTVRCEWLVNEGGGGIIEYGDRRIYCVGTAEKGVYRFRLITSGAAAHASMPRLGDNALVKLAPLLERMAERQPEFDLTEDARAFLEAIGELGDGNPAAALARVQSREPRLAPLLEPMLGVSLCPTRARASDLINVIPSHAHLDVDCRVPPGLDEEHVLRRIHALLGDGAYELSFSERVPGNRSAPQTPLWDFIAAWINEHAPGSTCAPTMLPGFTDSRTFRDAFPDCVAYGFAPHLMMTRFDADPLIHAADERIDVRDLQFAATFFRDLVAGMLG